MFDETIIVQTAVSAFNNAALAAPAFLWTAILTMPLFIIVYFCGNVFLEKIGLNTKNLSQNIALLTVGLTFFWFILFGGSYNVLRDEMTLLPFVVALIYLLTSLFIGSYVKQIAVHKWQDKIKYYKLKLYSLIVFLLLLVVLSDLHAWWGPLLQLGAVATGFLLGFFLKRNVKPVSESLIIMLVTIIAILMQPEFFRFGQLGSLTIFHLLFLLVTGISIIATIALRSCKTKSFIKHGLYIKLKWLLRFVYMFCVVLFVLTESVPVFLVSLSVFFISFVLSIWHADKLAEFLSEKMFAVTLVLFGVLTIMPAISALGIIYWVNLPCIDFSKQIKFLL